MSTRTIEQLERELHDGEDTHPGRPDLAAIREAGLRRRRLGALSAATGVVVATVGDSDRAREPEPADRPHQLSELGRRALAEIPGATQVSDWQVVLPAPDGGQRDWGLDDPIRPVGAPVDTGAHHYSGVTSYRPADFPHWLYDGVQHIEQTDLADEDGSYPVGSTDLGILVDDGPAYLGCVGTATRCGPALLTRGGDGGWVYEWGMGTDAFLKPGSKMEVFLSDDYATGAPGQLVLAGLPGTEVARVELVTVDGTRVAGHVESGTVVPGDTMMWGTVTGDLAAVI
ncbi:hypothetical protein, partial [Nocardioides sp.]|uniref:hypothetical protein n=1 Tax=Nocardioides sp. TaxID=35761 RepID=UPI0025F7B2D4